MAVPVSSGMLPGSRQQGGCLPGISENPSSPPTSDSNLVLIPSNLSLTSGQEAIVKLVNKSSHPMHWDLSWSVSHLSITPHAGHLSPHAQAVLCVQANTTSQYETENHEKAWWCESGRGGEGQEEGAVWRG